ncbi:hypothetical protein ACHQM5_026143 [Ranunculus cassubicifolius]
MRSKTAKKESTITKCVKAPFRFLGKVRDFYIRSVTDCSGQMSYGMSSGQVKMMPRNSSYRPNEDINELVRAISQRCLREELEIKIREQEQSAKKLPRSSTVGICTTIDEDEACDFDGDFNLVKPSELLYSQREQIISYSARQQLV